MNDGVATSTTTPTKRQTVSSNARVQEVKQHTIFKAREYYDKANRLCDKKQYSEAIIYYTKCVFLHQYPQYFVSRGKAYLGLCDLKSAISNFKKAYSLEPGDTSLLLELRSILDLQGVMHYTEKSYQCAIACFTEAINLSKTIDYSLSYLHRAGCHIAQGRIEEAFDDLKFCSNLVPYVNIILGQIYLFHRPNLMNCKDQLTIAKENFSDLPEVQLFQQQFDDALQIEKDTSIELIQQGRYEESLNVLNTAIGICPDDADLYVRRATCYKAMKNYTTAVKDALEALKISGKGNSEAEKLLAFTFCDMGMDHEQKMQANMALKYYTQAVRWFEFYGFYLKRGDCFQQLGRPEKALKDFRKAKELNTDRSDDRAESRIANLYNEWGKTLFRSGKHAAAEKEFSKAIIIFKKDLNLFLNRAKVRFEMKMYVKALEDIGVCYLLDQTNLEVKTMLQQYAPEMLHNVHSLENLLHKGSVPIDEILEANGKSKRMTIGQLSPLLNFPGLFDKTLMSPSESLNRTAHDLRHSRRLNTASGEGRFLRDNLKKDFLKDKEKTSNFNKQIQALRNRKNS